MKPVSIAFSYYIYQEEIKVITEAIDMTKNNMLSQIYLDSNATTQVHPAAAKAAFNAMESIFGNPSSSHISGLRAKNLMEQTRSSGKKLLGITTGKFIFTSGATEGIQTAILSALVAAKSQTKNTEDYCILYGATEHKAVPESLKHWNELLDINAEIKAIPVDSNGKLDVDYIAKEVPNALMICTMAVNNETGVYQDLTNLDQIIRTNNPDVFWMADCVQALGKTNLNIEETSIDYAPFSGHKLYAPKGIGFIYIKDTAPFTSFIAGGGQESGLRSGTENLPGMAALNVIFDILNNESNYKFASIDTLRQFQFKLITSLKTAFPNLVLNHPLESSVPTTINFSVPNFSSKEIMDLFDAANIRVSSGSACSSKVTRSFVLDAMGLPAWQSESAIRMSFGPMMTEHECQQACERITLAAKALSENCLLYSNAVQTSPLDGLLELRVGSSCCWLYTDVSTKNTVVIDPLPELTERIKSIIACQQLKLIAVLDTHGHADHESSRNNLLDQLPENQLTDHLGWPENTSTHLCDGVQFPSIQIGDYQLVKVPTPGHTGDSVSYLLIEARSESSAQCKYAFCGDTILMGSLGRTNFSSSCSESMLQSLIKISNIIGPDCLICASHDYHNEFTTTLRSECKRNPLLHSVLLEDISVTDFCQKKATLDSHLNDQQGGEIQCGAYVAIDESLAIKEYDSVSLQDTLSHNTNFMLVDIREPHEYALQHSNQAQINVPMTRLVQFIADHSNEKSNQYILVCRSGSRSLVVAQALARLGFSNIGHLQGGYALN